MSTCSVTSEAMRFPNPVPDKWIYIPKNLNLSTCMFPGWWCAWVERGIFITKAIRRAGRACVGAAPGDSSWSVVFGRAAGTQTKVLVTWATDVSWSITVNVITHERFHFHSKGLELSREVPAVYPVGKSQQCIQQGHGIVLLVYISSPCWPPKRRNPWGGAPLTGPLRSTC